MSRKSAIFMLVIVALWAAVPALLCFAVAPCHQCCAAMKMDDGAQTLSAVNFCCEVHSPNTAEPAANSVSPEFHNSFALAATSAVLPLTINPAGHSSIQTHASPPRSLLGTTTILRI